MTGRANWEGSLIFLPRGSRGFIAGGGYLGGIEGRGSGEGAGEESSGTGSGMYKSVKADVRKTGRLGVHKGATNPPSTWVAPIHYSLGGQ